MATWEQAFGNVTLKKRDGMEDAFGKKWEGAQGHIKTRLTQGVKLAPVMVNCAMTAITQYDLFLKGGGDSGSADLMNEVGQGLCKYFEFHEILQKEKNPSRWLRGILAVYGYVAEGMKNGFDVDLYCIKGDTAKGKTALDGVARSGVTSASLIRSVFGFVDEYGHTDWQGFKGGILMNMEWIAEPIDAGWGEGEALARVLVHEGTHRWAQTKDVLYKHKSAAWAANDAQELTTDAGAEARLLFVHGKYKWEKSFTPQQRQQALEKRKAEATADWQQQSQIALQNQVPIERDKQKPLLSMNVKGMAGKDPVDPIRWLENADSYAWFARRMWKRLGKPAR